MNDPRRPETVTEGQLLRELRRRDLSGARRDQLRHLSHLAELGALIDDIGGLCLATGPTSGGVCGLDGVALVPPFHVVIERGRNVRRAGHVIHTSAHLERIDRSVVDGIPTLSPTRTLIELARTLPADRLTRALDGALRDRLTSEDFLHRRIAALRGSGRDGIRQLLAVIEGVEITRGGQSFLEREFLRVAHAAGLPRPTPQVVLARRGTRLVRVDFHFTGTPLVVEVLGYRFHATREHLSSDAARLNRLVLDGFVPLQFTYDTVMNEATRMISEIREALVADRPFLMSRA